MLKGAVIGGGSTYTPELVMGFLERSQSIPLKELWLMDTDPQRLEIVGGFTQRILKAHHGPFSLKLSTNLEAAIAGSDYIITQFRVGQMAARRADEYLGRRHHLVGQETTGIGGLAKALRTIPVILQIAQLIRKTAPAATLLNFTNPSGLITEALNLHAPDLQVVGVCNAALTMKMAILASLQQKTGQVVDPARAQLKALGLNHLTWYSDFLLDGKSIWDLVLQGYLDHLAEQTDPEFDPHLVHSLGLIPNSYLKYYYHTDRMLARQVAWPPSRAEEVMHIEQQLLQLYADPDLHTPPPQLILRGGAWYSTAATQLINAHLNDLHETHVINLKNAGTVTGLDPNWVLETPCLVDRHGFHPQPMAPLPEPCMDLVRKIKAFEMLTIQASVNYDCAILRQALLAHPLGPDENKVDGVLADLLQTNQAYLPEFK